MLQNIEEGSHTMVMEDHKVLFDLSMEQLEFLYLVVVYFIVILNYLLNYFLFLLAYFFINISLYII